jgi:uncharacterized RDD family membrane protein YckC
MAQTVGRRPPTAEARIRARASPYGICGGIIGTGTGFFPEFFGFPLSVSFHQGSMLIYYPWEEEYYRWWPQVRT